MGSDGEDEAAVRRSSGRAKADRLAEALRTNLKRRKAQTRARGEVRPGESAPAADASGRDG